MINIISHGRTVEEFTYSIFYEWVEFPGSGFSFDCNEHGEINFNEMKPEGLANYEKCENDEYAVICHGLQRYVNRYLEPTIGECYCGLEIVLQSNTNECSCKRLYNGSGQELADPKHWGEETGEHPADVRRWMG